EAVVRGPARHAPGLAVLAPLPLRDEHLDGAPHLSLVLLETDALLELDETLVALLDHGLGQRLELVGGRPRTRGVLERERRGEARLLDHAQRLLEVLLGLAREAHDE